jgi:hypothetical protein
MSTRKRRLQTGIGPEAAVPALSHEEIERRAFRIFQERGAESGHDLEHWLLAERELLIELQRSAAGRSPA